MTINNRIIRNLETYTFQRTLPKELKVYLNDVYSEEPWPYEYSEQDLYTNIKQDINAYYAGKLDITIKTPLQKLELDNEYLRSLYGEAMTEIQDQSSYIDEIHELLWANGLEASRMLHSEVHIGSYKEFTMSYYRNNDTLSAVLSGTQNGTR